MLRMLMRLLHCSTDNTIKKFAPTKTKSIKPNKQRRAKWITAGIINSINHNKELYKKTIQINATLETKAKYAKHNKLLSKIKRYAKLNYYSNKC